MKRVFLILAVMALMSCTQEPTVVSEQNLIIQQPERGGEDCGECFEMTDGTCRMDCWDGSAWQSRPCVCPDNHTE